MSKKPNGDFFNAGIEAAKRAAAAVDGFVVWPEFPKDSPGQPKDFNDAAAVHGAEAVRDRIMTVVNAGPVEQEPSRAMVTMEEIEANRPPAHLYEEMVREIPLDYATEYDPAPKANRAAIKTSPIWDAEKIKKNLIWKKYPDENGPGKLEWNSVNNLMTYLRHHEGLNGVFRLDIFSGKITIHRSPPWENSQSFKIRDLEDIDITMLIGWLEKTARIMPGVGIVRSAVYAVAKECYVDPPLEWMERIICDKEPRLYKLFTHYFRAVEQPKELLEGLAKKWLIGGVARQYRPGCKLDNIVVFEGWGGAKKSTALETLATISGERYFSDGMDFDDLKNKDSIAISKGKLIIEFQEMGGLGTVGIDRIIKWLSIKTDECRVPYATQPQKFERRFLLAGTTNENVYLPAHGGIRRFWSVKCGDELDIAGIARDCEQLWAEAVYLYKAGEKWWIDRDDPIRRLVENEQRIRITERALEQPVLDYLEDTRPKQITA